MRRIRDSRPVVLICQWAVGALVVALVVVLYLTVFTRGAIWR